MTISLSPDLERFVRGKVDDGPYPSADAVVREALRLLQERDDSSHDTLEALRREIQIGIDQADRGEVVPLTDELIEDVKARGRRRLAGRAGRDSA